MITIFVHQFQLGKNTSWKYEGVCNRRASYNKHKQNKYGMQSDVALREEISAFIKDSKDKLSYRELSSCLFKVMCEDAK